MKNSHPTGDNMKVIVMNLDYPDRFFLKEFSIVSEDDLEKIQGYTGDQLYVRAEDELNDQPALTSAVRQIIQFHYQYDFKDAAIKLFKVVHKMLRQQGGLKWKRK